jgi:hypothetical protein
MGFSINLLMFLMRFCIIKESIEFLIEKQLNFVNLRSEKYKKYAERYA